jgi:hypothetical protein
MQVHDHVKGLVSNEVKSSIDREVLINMFQKLGGHTY